MINLKKNKPDLKAMFDKYITEQTRKEKSKNNTFNDTDYIKYLIRNYGSPTEDDYEDDDYDFNVDYNFDFDEICGYSKSKKAWKKTRKLLENFTHKDSKTKQKTKKETRRGNKKNKSKKQKRELFDTNDPNNRLIYFYRDIDNPNDVEMFFSLHNFDEFLQENGIEVSEQEVNNLMNRETSFCTINPDIKKTNGTVQLITDGSYGGLYWSCHEDEEIYSNC